MSHSLRDKQLYKTNKLTIKMPEKFDKWTSFGAGGPGTCPNNGLPNWKEISLHHKLPYIPVPEDAEQFSRGKAGQKLWTKKRAYNFRFVDAYNHTMHLPYDSLHDPCLKQHMAKPSVQKYLRTRGLVTADGGAVCNLRDINHFRQYITLMNLDYISYAINQEEKSMQEKRRLERIEEDLVKTKNMRSVQEKMEHVVRHNEKKRVEAQETRKRLQLKDQRKTEHIARLLENRGKHLQERSVQQEVKAGKVEKAHAWQIEWERRHKLKQIGRMRRRVQKHQQFMEMQKEERFIKSLDEVIMKWGRKKEQMKKEMDIAKSVAARAVVQREHNTEQRMAKANKVKAIQDGFRETIRQQNQKKSIELEMQRQKLRIINYVVREWEEMEDEAKIKFLADKVLNNMIFNNLSLGDPNLAIDACRKNIEKNLNTPLLVLEITDSIIEKSIEDYVRKVITPMIRDAKETVLKLAQDKSPILREKGAQQIVRRRQSLGFRDQVVQFFWGPSDNIEPEPIPMEMSKKGIKTNYNEELKRDCEKVMEKILKEAEPVIYACVEPTTRMRTIKKLAPFSGDTVILVNTFIKQFVWAEQPNAYHATAMGIVRAVANRLYKPKQLNVKENPYVTRYRLMVVGVPKK